MNKPLRGRRSGPLWFLILLLVGGGVYGARFFSPFSSGAQGPPTAAVITETVSVLAATVTAPDSTPSPPETSAASSAPVPTEIADLDFQQLILDYRRAERAALQTLDDDILEQAPIFAHGEALDAIVQQVEELRAADQYQILIVEDVQIQQVLPGDVIGVLINERHSLQTFVRDGSGDRLLNQEVTNIEVVYGFIEDNGRWKVDKVRIVG